MHSRRMRTARSLTVSRHILCTPPQQPRMPPGNHACPPATMHTPGNHAHPLQPCTLPGNHARPSTTMHTPQQPQHPPSNHAHPLQPCTPPPATTHTHPLATTHAPPVNRMTNRCKNITLPQTSFAGGNNTHSILVIKR